jgi:predicted kinase
MDDAPKKKTVVLGIGIPGAGKTSYLKPLAEKLEYKYVSPDDADIFNAAKQANDFSIWDKTFKKIYSYLRQGYSVILDTQLAKLEWRRQSINLLRENGANFIQGIYFKTSLEVAKERNSRRTKPVPEIVINAAWQELQNNPPKTEEGLDDLKIIINNET